jgi:hypothetical protein
MLTVSAIIKNKVALLSIALITVISVGLVVGLSLNSNQELNNQPTPTPQINSPTSSPSQTNDPRNNSAEYTVTVPVELAFGIEDRKNDWGTGGELLGVVAFFAWEPGTICETISCYDSYEWTSGSTSLLGANRK